MAVYFENHTKIINALCGQNTKFWMLHLVMDLAMTALWNINC